MEEEEEPVLPTQNQNGDKSSSTKKGKPKPSLNSKTAVPRKGDGAAEKVTEDPDQSKEEDNQDPVQPKGPTKLKKSEDLASAESIANILREAPRARYF